jgi:hypothetical protein
MLYLDAIRGRLESQFVAGLCANQAANLDGNGDLTLDGDLRGLPQNASA